MRGLAATAAVAICVAMWAAGWATRAQAQNAGCKVRDQDIAAIYKGACKDGLAHGQGLAKGRDTFEGEFREGDKVKGKYSYGPNACNARKCMTTYTGEFKDDTRDGQGEAVWSDGDTYRGTWSKGKPTGKTEGAKKAKAETCGLSLGEYQKKRCKVMTADNFQCVLAANESYRAMCGKK